jgi:ABC-type uncharacterized transport system ATPase subunit
MTMRAHEVAAEAMGIDTFRYKLYAFLLSASDPASWAGSPRATRATSNRTLLNELLGAVRKLRDAGKTVLLVEHDMKVVMGLCETVFVLDHGEKLAEGPPGQIQSDERVIEAYFGR